LQLDFGANRVVLVRNAAACACLPEAIRSSNAVIMEVTASKGVPACRKLSTNLPLAMHV
jgi:hypothetical protein